MHARYQGWMLGRFLSPDVVVQRGPTADPQVWNRYTYAANNPLLFVDPDGKSPKDFVVGVAEGAYGAARTLVVEGPQLALGIDAAYDRVADRYVANEGTAAEIEQSGGLANYLADVPAGTIHRAVGKMTGGAMVGVALGRLAASGPRSRTFLGSANAADRGGLTFAGRALQKHSMRAGSGFPSTSGMGPAAINQVAGSLVRDLLGGNKTVRFTGRFGKVVEFRNSAGQGVRFSAKTGKFIGFLEQ